MYHMKEVVGVSPEGFSQAVKQAIDGLLAAGETIDFFEVVEERGAVKDGALKEFQVKLKVAVVMTPKKAEGAVSEKNAEGVCPTCGEKTGPHGHMCVPVEEKDHTCDWCGALIPDERHLCSDKIKEISYICNSCGRTAVSAEHLCDPKKVE